jgi:predicted transcriptional regulator
MENNYLTIQGWMVSKLGLSGNDLLVFALIYGFSQDGETEFTGSINYITRWLNCSRPTAIKALKNLTENNILEKSTITMNGVSFNRYKANLQVVKKLYPPSKNDDLGSKETLRGVVKKLNGGSKETLPNNTINTIIDNIEEKEEEIYTPLSFDFKKSLLSYGFNPDLVCEWLQVRKAKKLTNTQTALNNFVRQVELTGIDKNLVLEKCVEKSWGGFESSWINQSTFANTKIEQKVLAVTKEGEEITDPLVFSVYKQMGKI